MKLFITKSNEEWNLCTVCFTIGNSSPNI